MEGSRQCPLLLEVDALGVSTPSSGTPKMGHWQSRKRRRFLPYNPELLAKRIAKIGAGAMRRSDEYRRFAAECVKIACHVVTTLAGGFLPLRFSIGFAS